MMFTMILMIITQTEKEKCLFDDMIADIMTNKQFQVITKELFIIHRRLNISLVFITQSYFSVPKKVRLNSTHHKRKLQQIATNHSAELIIKIL